MNRLTKILVICIGILFCSYYLSRALGIIHIFEAQAMSSNPAIKPGDWICTTNLKEPNALDFICFNQSNSSIPTGMWLQGVIGV